MACPVSSNMDMEFGPPAVAVVRSVPDSFDRCLRTGPHAPDPALARAQHEGYRAALAEAGVIVVTLPADEAAPDGCFVEDAAVIFGASAVITRPGAPERRGETAAVAAALAPRCALTEMPAPCRLDGGDVLRVGRTLLVGLSGRTDRAGLECLAAAAAEAGLVVRGVPVAAGLHLKSVVTFAAPGVAVAYGDGVDRAAIRALGLDVLAAPEPAGGNVLALGSRVLVSAAAPRTADMLATRGLTVVPLELSEIHRADGALTCLSLRLPRPGRWCA